MNDKMVLIEWITLIEQIDSSALSHLNLNELEKKFQLALMKLEDELNEF